jgi:MFS family permease
MVSFCLLFSSYLLAAASLAPLYGKLSNLIGELFFYEDIPSRALQLPPGRKPILYASIIIFLVRGTSHIYPHNYSPLYFRLARHYVGPLKT